MTRQIVIQSPKLNRRQPLLTGKASDKQERKGIGEVAGGTTAECAAVCCCCPCTLMKLLCLAFYKVPTGLCKKVWKKNKRRRLTKKRKALLLQEPQHNNHERRNVVKEEDGDESDGEDDSGPHRGTAEAVKLEEEMWDRFYGAGFWRSQSAREE